MEDQPGSRAPTTQGAIERGQHQGQVAPKRQVPPEYAARMAIHDDGEVAPLAGALHVHERMNVERLSNVLNLNAVELAELHRLRLELNGLATYLPWTRCPGHSTPLCLR